MLKPVLSGLALLLISNQVAAQPLVELNLSQLIDPTCQGTELLATSSAEPGQCIRYELKLRNTGSSAAQAVTVNLPVPKHTILKENLATTTAHSPLTQLQTSASGEQVLQTQIDKLEANQQLIFNYSVQIL